MTNSESMEFNSSLCAQIVNGTAVNATVGINGSWVGAIVEQCLNRSWAVKGSDHSSTYQWPVLFLFTIVVLALGGNILVCLAVRSQRKLHNMFNYFLVSLALSDMLSATLVMPLSIVKALIDELPVPKLTCVAWYSLDVLFTSSTIIHLCMISVDRYMALKYPLRYGHARQTRHFVLKILAVWVLSFCIAGPLFILSMYDPQSQVYYKGCGPESPIFVVSATVTSFYLPLLIMLIMYILTVRALHRQRKTQRKIAVTNSVTSTQEDVTMAPTSRRNSPNRSPKMANGHGHGHDRNVYQPALRHSGLSRTYPCITSDRSESNCLLSANPHLSVDLTESVSQTSLQRLGNNMMPQPSPVPGKRNNMQVKTFKFRRGRFETSARTTVVAPDKGRRAVQVLGILFAVFVIFYLPFFALYTVNGTCFSCRRHISGEMITAFEWLQYSGSMVNPIVYHIFNPDFRRAFKKLLRCRCVSC